MTAAHGWRVLGGWASLLGLAMIDTTPHSKPFELATVGNFPELWCQKLCAFFTDVVTLERAVDLICEGYFDGHDVLFKDSREELTSSYERAELLVVGYNCFAQENGKEAIDIDALLHCPERRVTQHLNECVMLSQSKVLAARGKVFEARDNKDKSSYPVPADFCEHRSSGFSRLADLGWTWLHPCLVHPIKLSLRVSP